MVCECEMRSAQKIFVWKPEWKRPLETNRRHVEVQLVSQTWSSDPLRSTQYNFLIRRTTVSFSRFSLREVSSANDTVHTVKNN